MYVVLEWFFDSTFVRLVRLIQYVLILTVLFACCIVIVRSLTQNYQLMWLFTQQMHSKHAYSPPNICGQTHKRILHLHTHATHNNWRKLVLPNKINFAECNSVIEFFTYNGKSTCSQWLSIGNRIVLHTFLKIDSINVLKWRIFASIGLLFIVLFFCCWWWWWWFDSLIYWVNR